MSKILSRETIEWVISWTKDENEIGWLRKVCDSHEALRERAEKLERVAKAAKKVTPYIPEVGDITYSYKTLADKTGVVTQKAQDTIWGWANDYDEALAALEAGDE